MFSDSRGRWLCREWPPATPAVPKAAFFSIPTTYDGGSDPKRLRLLSPSAIHVIHLNDYPADPPRQTITDANRILPGDGIAPLTEVFRNLRDSGFNGHLSLELFNRDYWKRSPVKVAREGVEKMRAVVRKAFA